MKYLSILIALLVLLMLDPSSVFADSVVPPYSYTKVSLDQKYVFVMIAPLTPEQDAAGYEEAYAAEIRKIRQTYRVSGLYRNDGSTIPLWTVDWYAYHVEVTSAGTYLVRVGAAAMTPLDEAVAFFEHGKLLRSYRMSDLVDLPWFMPRSVSHLMWKTDEGFDTASMTYTIRTLHGERLVFDVTTGQMIQASHPVRVIVGGIGFAVVLLTTLRIRRARKS